MLFEGHCNFKGSAIKYQVGSTGLRQGIENLLVLLPREAVGGVTRCSPVVVVRVLMSNSLWLWY